ncbi:hypothetical protein ABEB36_010794 [Hypothenemus hampei]|uniref:Uncharacterized protein n=1 Tax=Hypothenemus hampei TaxID=57062 RepID=A0ABD1ED56_HYPHA
MDNVNKNISLQLYEVQYTYNSEIYKIVDSIDVHRKLKQDEPSTSTASYDIPSPSMNSFSSEPDTPSRPSSRDSNASEDIPTTPTSHIAPPKKNKLLYDLRKKLVNIEEERIKALENLTGAVKENNEIQKERNTLIKNYLDTLLVRNK